MERSLGRHVRGMKIRDVPLPRDKKWMENHWKTIRNSYAKADFFSLHQDFFEGAYQKDFEDLWQMNVEITTYLSKCFEINVEAMATSELGVDAELRSTDFIRAALKSTGADIYLSGPSGRDYLDFLEFPLNDIGLRFSKFQHPVYQQRWPGFEPAMSAIDLLFNMGTQAGDIIKASGSIKDQ